jgi:hypothetical protein
MNILRETLMILFLAGFSCSASTVTLVPPMTLFPGPINLLLDGQPVLGTCISPDLYVIDSWEVNVLKLTDFPADQRTSLLEAGWLSKQFAVNSDWRGIHSAIWDVFGTSLPAGDPWLPLAAANYNTIDPNSISILVPVLVPSQIPTIQSFVITYDPDSPEPATYLLIASGLILIRRLRKASLAKPEGTEAE